ncbi:MAG: type III PLP-dependent enzyme [Amylibacter sp.]|nr:type III PLP-dependent enzyme [Amylibacter sp.]
MGIQQAIWQTRDTYLRQFGPDLPVAFFDPAVLADTARMFQQGFPGLVTYAVKANPTARVLRGLIAAGIKAFDVASPVEIDLVRGLMPDATLHYHNPIRSMQEITHAVDAGVRSYSVDRMGELEKLLAQIPDACEISVRLKLDLDCSAYNFGAKFGADADLCVALLRRVMDSGHIASMTFHPGTQCTDPQIWAAYISEVAAIAKRAKCKLHRLNVGGGFPSHRWGEEPDLAPIFDMIKHAHIQHFSDHAPMLVCEPGRAMVADSFSLALCVKTRTDSIIYLNDGIYGGLAEFRDIGHIERYEVISASNKPLYKNISDFTVFGPTCDSLDQLSAPLPLPNDIEEGDYILFENTGAYTHSIATRFNGYGDVKTVEIKNT